MDIVWCLVKNSLRLIRIKNISDLFLFVNIAEHFENMKLSFKAVSVFVKLLQTPPNRRFIDHVCEQTLNRILADPNHPITSCQPRNLRLNARFPFQTRKANKAALSQQLLTEVPSKTSQRFQQPKRES
ncbi:hypothetical protein BpHYR1_050561 [Brachionus plicatilis]|uniref:Uncharacterized protein n=1 Tax=Brachionus plicatilis TaxID=10195 RepID=A0A3M7PAN0_BRAPC|nr:hypothetical protein BpHYR1_050561 [Brachionus plicatilis]